MSDAILSLLDKLGAMPDWELVYYLEAQMDVVWVDFEKAINDLIQQGRVGVTYRDDRTQPDVIIWLRVRYRPVLKQANSVATPNSK